MMVYSLLYGQTARVALVGIDLILNTHFSKVNEVKKKPVRLE